MSLEDKKREVREHVAKLVEHSAHERKKRDRLIHEVALRHIKPDHLHDAIAELRSEFRKRDAPHVDDDDVEEFCDHYFRIIARMQPHVATPKQKIPESRTGHRWSH